MVTGLVDVPIEVIAVDALFEMVVTPEIAPAAVIPPLPRARDDPVIAATVIAGVPVNPPAVVAVAALPVQVAELPEQLPVNAPVNVVA